MKRLYPAILAATTLVSGSLPAANIAWVSFHLNDNTPSAAAGTAGFTLAPDYAYTGMLRDHGHTVTRFLTTGTPNTAVLNTYDLVIISRSVPSGDYQDPPETLAWNNALTAPTMILGGYVLRNNRLGFTTGTTMPDTSGAVSLKVNDPSHPIFFGVPLDSNNVMANPYAHIQTFNGLNQRGISVNSDPVAGGGTVLATVGTAGDAAFGRMIIGEWQPGAVLANTPASTLGGHRLVFLTGSRERDGLTAEGSGIYDLGPDGAQLFLNAVNYMAVPEPSVITLSIVGAGLLGLCMKRRARG